MAAAVSLALLSLAVLALGARASRLLQNAGGVAARAVLLLLPPAARNALSLLNCAPTIVPSAGCASLNGCSAGHARGRGSTVSVSLLASNSYYVCWAAGGAHAAAGALAAATLVVVVAGFSLVTLWAVWRWARLSHVRNSHAGDRIGGDKSEAAIAVSNPMRELGETPLQTRGASAGDTSACLPLLAPFLSDYRPCAWYTRHADLALTLLLAALQVRKRGSYCFSNATHPRTVSCRLYCRLLHPNLS